MASVSIFRLEIFKLNLWWHSINFTALAKGTVGSVNSSLEIIECKPTHNAAKSSDKDTPSVGFSMRMCTINFICNGCNNVFPCFLMGCISCMVDSDCQFERTILGFFGAFLGWNLSKQKSLDIINVFYNHFHAVMLWMETKCDITLPHTQVLNNSGQFYAAKLICYFVMGFLCACLDSPMYV